ncbi:MAG: DUF885 domain-containing protein [Gammaproteobacteria bacterium]|nr:DUF885 domain-containing protein [Gammaproteobacteria bacterium]MYH45206.1 DUF885 domain-containing protein [Gammaproteobacteria bacterium]MYL12444.1 DUF885 domain-containing protein [Gammaproteobacteria bacterium]
MKQLFPLVLVPILLLSCAPPESREPAVPNEAAAADTTSAELHALFEDEWRSRLARDPLFASYQGVTDYNGLLPDVSPAAQERYLEEDRRFLERLARIDREALSAADSTNHELFEFIVGNRVKLAEYRPWRIPILSDDGFHMSVQRMYESAPLDSVEDYERYLARLQATGDYFDQNIANMRQGIADGFTQPRAILEGILPSISGSIVEDPEESVFFTPFLSLPGQFDDATAERLREAGRQAIAGTVVPAYRRFLNFFAEEYIPGARETLGTSALENGRAYYEELTRFFTTREDATPDAIHELGLREVARIRAEMENIITQLEFDGSFADFIEFLRTDPQFYVEEPEQLLKEASWIAKKIDGQMPAFFRTLPRMPYGVEPVPDEIAPNYTTGRYWGAPAGGRRGGYYMVNTYALDIRPLYTLAALTAHEGVPGHHHQGSIRNEIEDLPDFRRAFYPHAFGEGWGLYAEKLGIEMNIYETPYDHFGRLSYEMWRAVRLVVDTGIHYQGWSREQAQDYLAENSALSLHNVRTEIDRYIAWPGQALAYKIGELTILELRGRAESELGENFDIRDFHDAVLLSGGLTMDMLEQEIERYIENAGAGR